ncbi:MAG TPA: tail fiber domain-containing protein [Pyrinomonadaceae bacterium]|jgi:hypothetical protein
MKVFRRAALIVTFILTLALSASAQEQTLRTARETVRVTAARDKVRVLIGRDLYATQVEVSNASGEIIYESGLLSGDSFDWRLRDSLGERVAAGDYTLTITYRTPAGKLMRRTEQVSVQDDDAAAAQVSAAPTPTSVGTITGEGTAGKIAKFDGPNSITSSAVLTESAGKLLLNGSLEVGAASGVGVNPTIVNPKNIANFALVRFYPATGTNVNTSFTVVPRGTGQPNNRAQFSITNTDAIADPSNVEFAALRARGADFVFGTGKSGTGVIRPLMFSAGYMTDNATNANQLVLATNGGVGVGTATPIAGIKLEVSGVALINPTGASNGGQMQFGTPNAETGMSIKYPTTGRADLRFDGQTLKLVAGPDSGPPADTSGVVIDATTGMVSIGATSTTFAKLNVDGGTGKGVDGRGDEYGLRGEGDVGVSAVGGTYGVYATGPTGVSGGGSKYGVVAETYESTGWGLWARNTTGAGAGIFDGQVQVNGALTATGNVCAANIPCSSDARLKQNVTNLKYGLDQLLRLRPVSWRWKNQPEGKPQMGLVAQEVEKVLPELVLKDADATQPLALNYMALLPVAVKAIQEQQAQIREQQKQIERLQARVAQLERSAKKRNEGRPRSRR